MPLVKKEEKKPVVLVGFNMRKNLREEVKDYCEWAEVKDGKFYITAIEFVFRNLKVASGILVNRQKCY